LFPMSHVAERSFYRTLSESFTSNSIILMEGVSDERGLLTNRISYQRMAKSLGVAEQQKEFRPIQGEIVRADVDVEQFTTNTIGFLNLIMLVHSKGLNAEILMQIVQYSPSPGFEQELFDDLLRKRNRHLVEELRSRLSQSEQFVVPWGAAHMPGIEREIQKLGFRLDETRDFTAIRFRSAGKQSKVAEEEKSHGRSK
jgi:TraB/PrgY/gumN family